MPEVKTTYTLWDVEEETAPGVWASCWSEGRSLNEGFAREQLAAAKSIYPDGKYRLVSYAVTVTEIKTEHPYA